VGATLDFEEFYSTTFKPLTAQLHAFIGDHAEAQDLVQEAYCRAYARWSSVSTYDDPVAWVRRVAWNMAVSRWRQARRLLRHRRELSRPAVDGPDGVRLDLAQALAQLPVEHRRAIVLYYLADMSVHEITVFTGATEGTVKSWLHRGRIRLGQILGDGEVANV